MYDIKTLKKFFSKVFKVILLFHLARNLQFIIKFKFIVCSRHQHLKYGTKRLLDAARKRANNNLVSKDLIDVLSVIESWEMDMKCFIFVFIAFRITLYEYKTDIGTVIIIFVCI